MNERQLQELLSVYRHAQAMPALPRRSSAPRWWLISAAAAAVIIIAFVAWPRRGWRIGLRALRAGETIAAPARIRSRAVGWVDVGADTVVRYEGGNRLSLARGTIHAKTISPPGVFIVDTPSARAVDLGCEYVLRVAPSGGGALHVTAGWVQLQRGWQQTLVPEGAHVLIDAESHIGPPLFDDAAPAFQTAIARRDIDTALPLARKRDALTLINLFRDATPDERLRIYDRLNQLVPAPPSVPRDAVRSWTVITTYEWWQAVRKASGVPPLKKKKR
jgi:hypothetical protein